MYGRVSGGIASGGGEAGRRTCFREQDEDIRNNCHTTDAVKMTATPRWNYWNNWVHRISK